MQPQDLGRAMHTDGKFFLSTDYGNTFEDLSDELDSDELPITLPDVAPDVGASTIGKRL
jgi:hypothetical protein